MDRDSKGRFIKGHKSLLYLIPIFIFLVSSLIIGNNLFKDVDGTEIDPIWYGITNSFTFVDGSIGCENASFEINNTDKSLILKNNYKSFISNRMAPFIVLANGNKYYIKDLLPTYNNRLNFSIKQISCGKWKFGLDLSIPQTVDVDYIGFSYENILGNPNIELDRENHQVSINNGESELIIDWSDIANRISLNRTTKEVLINITGIKNINIDPTVTFSTAAIEGQSITPLDNNTFVLAYCDETNDDISFIVFNTNGTNLTGKNSNAIDVDSAIGSCFGQSVDVSAFNSTHFVIGYVDTADLDATFAIYNRTGSQIVAPTDVDTSVCDDATNVCSGVSVSTFNSTHWVIGYMDISVTDNDTTTVTYNWNSVILSVDVDTNIGTIYQGYQLGVSTFNSTRYVVAWYDYPVYDITFAIYNSANVISGSATDADIDASLADMVVVATLNSTHHAMLWNDGANDLNLEVFNQYTSVFAEKIIETDVSTSEATIDITAINSTNYVMSWGQLDVGTNVSSYNSLGNNVWSNLLGDYNADGWSAIASLETGTYIGFCNNNIIVSYTASLSQANWTSYMANGTAWNGICPAADTTPPTYSLNSTNSTTAGTPIEFRLYWQDNVGLSKAITSLWNGSSWVNATSWCSLSGTTSWCNQTMVVNSTAQQLWWKQYANDTSNNWNTSENFSLVTTSAGAPDINLTFGPLETIQFRVYQNSTGGGCGPYLTSQWVEPRNQTSEYGIYKLCNNGTASGNIQASLTGAQNAGWIMMLTSSNSSSTANAVNMTQSYQTIYSNLAMDSCIYTWAYINCTQVTIGPGITYQFQAV